MDGMTLEFYRAFRSELVPHLLELFKYCLQQSEIPATWKEVRLVVFPKKGKDARYPEAYRPISNLNVDYKVLAMIPANRLSNIIGMYIHPDQTGFIKGRNLKTNTRTLNIINRAQVDKILRTLLFVDAEKAFDMIE